MKIYIDDYGNQVPEAEAKHVLVVTGYRWVPLLDYFVYSCSCETIPIKFYTTKHPINP